MYDSSAPIPGWPPQPPYQQQPPGQPPFPQQPYQQPPGQPYQDQPAYPVQQQFQPPPPRRRRLPLWAWITGGVVVAALIAGLVIWQPWNPPPNPVTGVRVSSPTATSAVISWTAPQGGAKPDKYLIDRDGRQVGSVPAGQTSYTDNGLAPGSRHSYTVYAHGDGQQSKASAPVSLTTLTPPPVNVTQGKQTYTSVVINWDPAPKAPAPTTYTIYNGSNIIGTVNGSTTTYTASDLVPGSTYQITVTEQWGNTASDPSAAVTAATLKAPLSGSVSVNFKVTAVPSGSSGLTKGETWGDTWQFTATCSSAQCQLSDSAELAPPNLKATPFTVALKPTAAGYAGSSKAQFSSCGSVKDQDSISLTLRPNSGGVSGGAWVKWSGTMVISAPYTKASSTTFCPAQSWTVGLTS